MRTRRRVQIPHSVYMNTPRKLAAALTCETFFKTTCASTRRPQKRQRPGKYLFSSATLAHKVYGSTALG